MLGVLLSPLMSAPVLGAPGPPTCEGAREPAPLPLPASADAGLTGQQPEVNLAVNQVPC